MVSFPKWVMVCVCVVAWTGCSGEPGPVVPDGGVDPTETRQSPGSAAEEESRSTTMRGLFSYMADAAVFVDCETGDRYPVAMEAGYIDLERAYLEAGVAPGAPLLVTFDGDMAPRPPMEGDGLIDMVIVERFEAVHPGKNCEE